MEATPFGRYRLLALLGRGGMGEVWRAHDIETDRIVAVKLLPAHLAHDSAFQKRFRREAQIAAAINEPHVVPIHNFGEIDGRLYVDMRLIEGNDLEALLAQGPIGAARAVKIIEQVGMALNAAHRAGLVHRDIKPSNILLAEHDFAYLIDFGIARAVNGTALTATGVAVGTVAYMAPERFRGDQIDLRSDIYSLTCVLYECLTGKRPFRGESQEQMMAGHLMTPAPQPSRACPGVAPAFDAVVARGMAKDPDDRYGTTLELADAAAAVVVGRTTKSIPEHVKLTEADTSLVTKNTRQADKPMTASVHTFPSAPAQHQVSVSADPSSARLHSGEIVQKRQTRRRASRRIALLGGLFAVVAAAAAGVVVLFPYVRSFTILSTRTVSKSDVESQISQKMTDAAGNKPESVSCPDDLKATVGAKLDCNMKIKGQSYGVNVTVTGIEGSTAKFDMVETLNKNDVAKAISDQLEQQAGKKPDSVNCPDNLKGVQGATLRCTLTDGADTYGVNVTVTSVDGGDVKFDFKVDDQPITSTTTSPTP
jgi:serine/threonine protein kinase